MRIVKPSEHLEQTEKNQIKKLLELIGWNQNQVEGQLGVIEKFLKEKNWMILFAIEKNTIIGYISAEFYSWNRLGQIHGLVIHPDYRNKGFASTLVKDAEVFMKKNGARGIYADTPVDNSIGCAFYKDNNFQQAYVMPEYYDNGLDGVTFLKLFR